MADSSKDNKPTPARVRRSDASRSTCPQLITSAGAPHPPYPPSIRVMVALDADCGDQG